MAKAMDFEALQANLRMIDKRGEMDLELLRRQDAAGAEKAERVGELLKDEGFTAAFLATASAGEACALFAAHGVELTREQVTALAAQIESVAEKLLENRGELSMEELEQIAGGRSFGLQDLKNGAGFSVIGAGIGTMFCIGIGTAAGAAIGAVAGIMVGTPIAEGAKAVKRFFNWLF